MVSVQQLLGLLLTIADQRVEIDSLRQALAEAQAQLSQVQTDKDRGD